MAFRFQISANLLSWPNLCACCGGSPDTKLNASASRVIGKRVRHTTTSSWSVPYCSKCVHHKTVYESASNWLLVSFILGLIVWFFVAKVGGGLIGFFAGIVLALLGFWPFSKAQTQAKSLMLSSCCSQIFAVRYVEWYGTFHTFVFFSKSYLELFLAANSRKKRSEITEV